ncbi:MAG: exodeoxyribonuclease V subunit gamma, partial [Gammaproteobacteria bacterium]
MLHLHTGNRLEDLADALIEALGSEPAPPLDEQTVICESPALAAWLKQRFCRQNGIACLLDTRLPAAWLWQQARALLGLPREDDPLDRERLGWRILAALPALAAEEAELARYLDNDPNGLKRWQLARHLADLFDRYQYHRPELIRAWEAAPEDGWQARLWQQVSEGVEDHRLALMGSFLEALQHPNPDALPRRIDLFSIHNLPPLLLQAFAALARHLPVHLWLLAPTPEYWADLESPRRMARQRRDDPESMALWQAGNPLLTQWGRLGQAFQDLLLDESLPLMEDSEHFAEPERDSLLHQIQADIFTAVAPEDTDALELDVSRELPLPSLQFHVCHGPLRECQALHDTLLHCLDADPELEPEDILVMVPEISRYAPYIEAVFGSAPAEHFLPWNLTDTFQADEHPMIRVFLDLLALPESRFGRNEVLAIADLPRVRAQFGLEEADIAELTELFDALRVYWGLDAAHRKGLGLPGIDDNTWQQAFERILAGFATGSDALLDGRIAPVPRMTALKAERAARFFTLLDRLRYWSVALARPATPDVWGERLGALLKELFGDGGEDEDRLQRIRDAIEALEDAEKAGVPELEPAVIRQFMEEQLGQLAERGRPYRGGVTFCAMKPLRGVPFRVIALLGMQDGAFPRPRRDDELDRMQEQWRHGDPDRTEEDRYLFLETMLAARDRLIISWTGRDARSNEPLQPSVVVGELIDYIDARYRLDGIPPGKACMRTHGLHPFSPANFDGQPQPEESRLALRAHGAHWLQAARAMRAHEPSMPKSAWPDTPLPPPEEQPRVIAPDVLDGFFRHPVRQFLQQRLRLQDPNDALLAEDEPFTPDGLQAWQIRDRLLSAWVQTGDPHAADAALHACGWLPHGPWSEITLTESHEAVAALIQCCEEDGIMAPLAFDPQDIDLEVPVNDTALRVAGRIHTLHPEHGLLLLSASSYSPLKLLPLWIRHLCLQALGIAKGQPACGYFTGREEARKITLKPLDADEARAELSNLLAWFETGLIRPLPLPEYSTRDLVEVLDDAW